MDIMIIVAVLISFGVGLILGIQMCRKTTPKSEGSFVVTSLPGGIQRWEIMLDEPGQVKDLDRNSITLSFFHIEDGS